MHLFTASLPWCLHAMDQGPLDQAMLVLAEDIAHLASLENKASVERIMTSFAKGRFRTKDDFLRQIVAALREHFLPSHALGVVTLLLGLTLNSRDWLREKTMLILKLVFQAPEARALLATYGAELLMPLLHLLDTPFASHALEVLNEPITIQGGPAASAVLRMSMAFGDGDVLVDNIGEFFGTPEDSGWSVAKVQEQSAFSRQNALAVFNTLASTARVQSSAHFSLQFAETAMYQPGFHHQQLSIDSIPQASSGEHATLGKLVGDLASLRQFFDEGWS